MEDLMELIYVEGDMMQTVCRMTVLFIALLVVLDVVYVLKSSIKASSF